MNIYRWLVLVLSAPLELLKAPTFQRRYKKIKEAYLQLTSTSSWNRHALNATNSTSGGQLGVAGSVERLGKYVHKIGRELKKRETRIGRTQRREPYATNGVGLNCWGKIVVKMKCLGGLKA